MSVVPDGHLAIVSSGRLRKFSKIFLHFPALAQRDLLAKLTRTKAYKNDFQLLPKELDATVAKIALSDHSVPELVGAWRSPRWRNSSSSSSRAPAGAVSHEELMDVELLECGSPGGADRARGLEKLLEVEVASPSCKRVTSKSAGSSASPTPPFRRVRLRQQRHRS